MNHFFAGPSGTVTGSGARGEEIPHEPNGIHASQQLVAIHIGEAKKTIRAVSFKEDGVQKPDHVLGFQPPVAVTIPLCEADLAFVDGVGLKGGIVWGWFDGLGGIGQPRGDPGSNKKGQKQERFFAHLDTRTIEQFKGNISSLNMQSNSVPITIWNR
jgi:hypothetical protein